jgi:hypothetical protein
MPKTGVDDYLAAGGTVAALKLMARPFNPEEFATERLSRDDQLREALEALRAECRAMPAVKIGECSEVAVMRDFIRTAERSGTLAEDGVRVIRSARDGADGAQTSLGGWKNAVDRLVAAGRIRRDFWGRAKDKPGAYVLLTPWGGGSVQGEHNGGGSTRGERQANTEEESFSRENPLSTAAFPAGVHVARAPFSADVPELRWPRLILTWERREGRRVVVDSEYVARLGKRRREIIAYLWEAGGSASVEELKSEYGARRGSLRDFRRWILAPLTGWRYDRKPKRWTQFGPPIIAVEGDCARLVGEWREALERHRAEAGEIEDARLQAERHAREKQAFRKAAKDGADPTPELGGREHVRRTLGRHRPRWAREEEQERRQMVRPAADFVSDILGRMDYIRLGLLEDMWREASGGHWHLRLALRELRCKVKRHAEHPGELFVYPPATVQEDDAPRQETPAAVVHMPRKPEPEKPRNVDSQPTPARTRPYRRADGVYLHPGDCVCEWCAEDLEASYARPFGDVS